MFDLLEEIVMAENNETLNTLVQPLVNQVGLNNCRAKAALVLRLSRKWMRNRLGMLSRVDKFALVERYVAPLLQPSNKIQQEAIGN